MRFLHTSDWHLGRLFHNYHLTGDQRHILEQFLAFVKDANLDAVIIAGDLYDRAVPPTPAVELLDDVLSTLVLEFGVPTVIIAGNHDSPQRLGFGSRLLREKGLYIAGALDSVLEPIELMDQFGPIRIVPIPFCTPEAIRDWSDDDTLRGYEASMRHVVDRAHQVLGQHPTFGQHPNVQALGQHPNAQALGQHPNVQALGQHPNARTLSQHPNTRTIAVAHAFVTGGEESESERALAVGGSEQIHASVFEGFDYVALGHLHRPQTIETRLRYSGSLLKYSFSEINHKKSMSLVDMDGDGQFSIEEIEFSPRRELRSIEGKMEELLATAPGDLHKEDYILAILTNREPLLNPMAKLREYYPNVLHIERPHFGAATATGLRAHEQRKMTTVGLFEAFWKQARSEELGEQQRKVLARAIAAVEENL